MHTPVGIRWFGGRGRVLCHGVDCRCGRTGARVAGVPRGMRDFAMDTSRGLAAAGVLLAAVVHLDLWPQGFRDIHTIGALFLLNVIAGPVIGVALLMWRHRLPAVAAVGFGLATIVTFWISVVHGLFGVMETAAGTPEILAELAEYATVFFGLAAAALLWQAMREHIA
jgi:hypothetical protein